MRPKSDRDTERSEFLDSLKKGALIGLGILVLVVPPLRMARNRHQQEVQPPVAMAPQATQPTPQAPGVLPQPPQQPPRAAPAIQLADFRGMEPSGEARLVANWAHATGDHKQHAFVLVDKADARVYVFGPDGKLKDSAPALLGAYRGDDSAPGIGDKPLKLVKPWEKTTPAGRFVAEPGENAGGEDVVWVSYDLAVSMHRIRPLVASEHRLERLASRTIDDNRISFGCINLPVTFYEDVLAPTVRQYGAVVYVLPEVKSPQQVFGAYDVTSPESMASAGARVQQVALQK